MAQATISQQKGARRAPVSALDPVFLVFAFPLAFFLDILSYVFMGLDAGVIAALVNIVLGGALVFWMTRRGMSADRANEMLQESVSTARQGKAGLQQRRASAQSMGIKALRKRRLLRPLIMYVGNSIPIVNFIPFWLIGIILMLREK